MINIKELNESVFNFLCQKHQEDTNFLFTMRGTEKGWEEGLWFYGRTPTSLHFSCWDGQDYDNKTPCVYFEIDSTGGAHLNFVARNPQWRELFFIELSDMILAKRSKHKGKNVNHWRKYYINKQSGTTIEDCLLAIDTFLTKDKIIIDNYLQRNNTPDGFMPPLFRAVFDNLITKILNYKNYQIPPIVKENILLKDIKMKNISLLNDVSIKFSENVTCFIGLNGTAKTTILRAIILGLTGYNNNTIVGEDNDALEQIKWMLRIESNKVDVENVTTIGAVFAPKGVIELAYELSSYQEKTNTIYLDASEQENYNTVGINDDLDSDFDATDGDNFKSLVLAFPQVQSGNSKNNKSTHTKPHINDTIALLNNQPDNRFGRLTQWISKQYAIANDKKAKGETNPIEIKIIEDIFLIISEVTGETVMFDFIDVEREQIWVIIDNAPILFNLISQGYHNVFGWIGYFIKRLLEVTPPDTDYRITPAIVLIDEIDTYLHPQWQWRIMSVLVKHFEQVQFVITTHSPYVVGSIPKEKLKVYVCQKNNRQVDVEEFTTFTPFGVNIERLSRILFDTPARYNDADRIFNNARTFIQQNKFDEAEETLQQLIAMGIDSTDPELRSLTALLNTKKRLNAQS